MGKIKTNRKIYIVLVICSLKWKNFFKKVQFEIEYKLESIAKNKK